jgi:hypothetical protein
MSRRRNGRMGNGTVSDPFFEDGDGSSQGGPECEGLWWFDSRIEQFFLPAGFLFALASGRVYNVGTTSNKQGERHDDIDRVIQGQPPGIPQT